MAKLIVDRSECVGKIKPMHGVGQPPYNGIDFSMFKYLKDAGIPFSRLHDVGFFYGRFLDIPFIFKDQSKDPEDETAYDFSFADLLITALVENGVEPFIRLGVSIENYCAVKAYDIYPPKDKLKWAKICEGIIRHYTQGWAKGFNYNIRFWEIWNEPDNYEDPMENQMWRGDMEEYFELYGVASKYLKDKFPHLMIGGYGSCGFYDLKKSFVANANSSPRKEYFIVFFKRFLEYITANKCPLDFFSWHSYDTVENNAVYAKYARDTLDEAGYKDVHISVNEWNSLVNLRGTAKHAAVTAAMMLSFEDLPVDSAMFYDARLGTSVYGSMFDPSSREPYKTYWSFVAFNELYKRGEKLALKGEKDGLYAVCARGEKDEVIVVANPTDDDIDLEIDTSYELYLCEEISEKNTMSRCFFDGVIKKNSVLVMYFLPKAQ